MDPDRSGIPLAWAAHGALNAGTEWFTGHSLTIARMDGALQSLFAASYFSQVFLKGVPMDKPPALPQLTAADEQLKRAFKELQRLREAVAEAERSYLDREPRPLARPLS
jgi:hypothetical protein